MNELSIFLELFGNLAPVVAVGWFFWREMSKLIIKYIDLQVRTIEAIEQNTSALNEIRHQSADNRIINRAMIGFLTKELDDGN